LPWSGVGLALASVPSSTAYSTDQYAGPNQTFLPWQGRLSYWNYWKTNRVWRPVGNPFSAYYLNEVPGRHGLVFNTSRNPFESYGPFGYSQGGCDNETGNYVNSVTCQVYSWYA
jgi:hypothetical protein